MKICQANSAPRIAQVRALFAEYADGLGIDLSFQGFAEELTGLPGLYAAPQGRLLLARAGSAAAGCVALRPLYDGTCEMKRLFVCPRFRGQGIGLRLSERIVEEARAIGYQRMRLDTLPSMHSAMGLYAALGFSRCAAYYETPLPDTVFMELRL